MAKFSDRTVIVTGASSGLGAQTAAAFAARGATTLLVARRVSKLQKICKAIQVRGGRAFPLKCDLLCPLETAKLNGVEIHTIGIGSVEATGEDRVDFETLENIASRTGGRFFNAEDETALAQVYREIDEATTADVRTQSWRPRESLVFWPAGIAVVILGLAYAILLLGGRRRKLPA